MSKKFLRTLCVVLCIILCLPLLAACTYGTMYELGPYSLSEDEYAYLMCTYKRQILEQLGLDESYMDYTVSEDSDTTYGEYIEKMYRESFEQSVYTLIYTQALFDEYGLSLSDEEKNTIKAVANAIIYEYGNGNATTFNQIAGEYGFSHETLYSVYEKQAKESAVINHLFGSNYSKVTEEQLEDYYEENYLHFQALVVNTLYQENPDGTFSNLSEAERNTKLLLEEELIKFLSQEDMTYDYKILPKYLGVESMAGVTYEDIWKNEKINDDMTYVGGMYMLKPNAYQMTTVNTLSQAMLTAEGDVSALKAKRYFENDGYLTLGDSTEVINKGDYFEYGTAFIKRLPLEDKAWQDEANSDFFGDSSFVSGAARSALFNILSNYEKTSPYTLMLNEELKAEYTLSAIPANYLDYDYFHQSTEK